MLKKICSSLTPKLGIDCLLRVSIRIFRNTLQNNRQVLQQLQNQ